VLNHGLAALLILSDIPEIGQKGPILARGGATFPVWFASRELGVASIFATQIALYGYFEVIKPIIAWKKDFWAKINDSAVPDEI
jgi:hypothetical protein